ncbi:hypothetical protein OB2597_14936 [Pseudooceanicola batsensis HTCC2597]|uniref:Transcription factor zinc-finger domain-containing protein n=1 Tax=Pseudooceanicola batsensis (strain ATCC BAA-863 / DSM 15984 / KCTC 12145 / HTCC2597) TaxID=252305 RepID=A3U2E9_PSEBH|nr:zf-TFIIB domain-containing protein [Pseudooceanicola batsensis]EAQ01749.1 hypothetical protein OB2597_14936 [Pseudooceanicola batsensis HTCC2597]
MKCPVDDTELLMTARQGVEIDYCPRCRGVWLDRGELDKIIDRQTAEIAAAPPDRPLREAPPHQATRYRDYPERRHDDGGHYKRPKYKKRKSILAEIFDFD